MSVERKVKTAGKLASAALSAAFIASACEGTTTPLHAQGDNFDQVQTQYPEFSPSALKTTEGIYIGPTIGTNKKESDNFGDYFSECQSTQQLLQAASEQNKFPFPIVPSWYYQTQLRFQPSQSSQDSFMEVESVRDGPVYHDMSIIAPFDVTPVDPNTDEGTITESYVIHLTINVGSDTVDEYHFVKKDASGNTIKRMIVIGIIGPEGDEAYPTHGPIKAGQLAIRYNFSDLIDVPSYLRDTVYVGFDNTGHGPYQASLNDFAADSSGKPYYCMEGNGTYTEP